MSGELVVPEFSRREERALPVQQGGMTPMQMVALAVQRGDPIETVQKLMDLQERWEATQARKAFNQALAAFKAEAIVIVKATPVTDGPLKGKSYANLYAIVGAVTPALSKHGLSISWKPTKDEKDWIEITCTLKHDGGHSESVSFGGPPDTGPGRNAMQARGSTKTYLEKYTATAILGLAAADQDDDGAGGKPNGMSESAIADHIAAMDGCATLAELQKAFSIAYKAAEALKDKAAMKSIVTAKDVRKSAIAKKGAK